MSKNLGGLWKRKTIQCQPGLGALRRPQLFWGLTHISTCGSQKEPREGALRLSQHLPGEPSPSCSLPPSTLLSEGHSILAGGDPLAITPCCPWGTSRTAHPRACVGAAAQDRHVQVYQWGRTCSPGRCHWRWTGRAGSGHSTASWGWLCGPAGAGRHPWSTGRKWWEDGGLQGHLPSRGISHGVPSAQPLTAPPLH